MPLVNNRDENVVIHYGTKGMKWGVRKQYHRVAGAAARRQGKSHAAKAAAAQKKIDKIKSEPTPKRKKMSPETRAKIELGAAAAGALIGAFGTVAMWKLSAGSGGAEAQTVASINRLFVGG